MRMVHFASLVFGSLAIAACFRATAMAAGEVTDMKDVAMAADGQLQGMVVDSSGAGVPGIPVSLRLHNEEVASVTTNKEGIFSVEGLKGGVYQVATPKESEDFRVWMADAAPPTAADKVVLRQDGPAVLPVSEPCPVVEVADPLPPIPPLSPPPPVPVAPAAPAATGGLGASVLASAAVATAIAVPVSLTTQKTPVSP